MKWSKVRKYYVILLGSFKFLTEKNIIPKVNNVGLPNILI